MPDTIISRTQRFAFKPISPAAIAAHLKHIAETEGIEIDASALESLAIIARGGFRDAISLLDQMSSSGPAVITDATVRTFLGLGNAVTITAISRAIAVHDTKGAIEAARLLEDEGVQPGQAALQLATFWRELMMQAIGVTPAGEADTAIAQDMSVSHMGTIIETFMAVTKSPWPREALEVAIVKASVNELPSSPRGQATAAGKDKPAPAKSGSRVGSGGSVTATDGAEGADGAPNAELWPKVLVLLRAKNHSLAALLQMYPVDVKPDGVTIRSRFNFHRDLFMKAQNRQVLEEAVAKVYGKTLAVDAITDGAATPPKRPANPEDELVSSALEILGGEVVE